MKTKKFPRTSSIIKIIPVLSVTLVLIFALSSCATRIKSVPAHTEIAPPPPPPPPPPTSGVSSNAKDNVKITGAESDEEPFVVVEEMPAFPGGDEALLKYIVENVKYPEASKNNKTEGKVIVRFCVTAKGNVDKLSVLRGVTDDIDAEALRVVKTLPDFKPGKQGGKEVPVWYMVPINFALK